MKKGSVYIGIIDNNKKYKLSDSNKYENRTILIKVNDNVYINFKYIKNNFDFLIYYLYGFIFADSHLNSQFNKKYVFEESLLNYFKEEEWNEKISIKQLKKIISPNSK